MKKADKKKSYTDVNEIRTDSHYYKKIKGIAEKCIFFKIGKASKKAEDRNKQPTYNKYPEYSTISTSVNYEKISRYEAACIKKFKKEYPDKCKNKNEGSAGKKTRWYRKEAPSAVCYVQNAFKKNQPLKLVFGENNLEISNK